MCGPKSLVEFAGGWRRREGGLEDGGPERAVGVLARGPRVVDLE
jgi:hypothetical protein